MSKHQYQINDRVFVLDYNGKIPGTITDTMDKLYKVEYDGGGYDWLIHDEIMPLEYHVGEYVETPIGIGVITAIDQYFFGIITVSYGKNNISASYYEYELKPAPKPSFLKRLFGKGVYVHA